MKIEVLYLGERVRMMSGIQHAFRGPKGEEWYWKSFKGYFGNSYYAEKTRTDVQLKRRGAEEVPEEKRKLNVTALDRENYEAAKIVCRQYRADRVRMMNIKAPHKDILRAIAILRPFVRNLNHFDLERFMNWVKNEISKKGKR